MNDYSQIIQCFLSINPEPSDAQVHSFASALGVDKEELEAQMYAMLSDCMDSDGSSFCGVDQLLDVEEATSQIRALTEVEEVLQDDYDEDAVKVDLVPLNDGSMNPNKSTEIQELTNNDGSIVPTDVQDLLLDDGMV